MAVIEHNILPRRGGSRRNNKGVRTHFWPPQEKSCIALSWPPEMGPDTFFAWTSRALQQIKRRIAVGGYEILTIGRKSEVPRRQGGPAPEFLAGTGFPEFDLLS